MKVFIFIMMMIFSFSSKADEVYNFYFQKTAAEATKPSGTDLTSPSPIQELQKDVKQENPSKSKLKKMELAQAIGDPGLPFVGSDKDQTHE